MSYRANYYSEYPSSKDAEQQYLMSSNDRGRNGHPDSSFCRGDTLPLHQMSSSSGPEILPARGKKGIGTLDVINPMEQETLLDPGPVRLAPCWESRHAPNDELKLKIKQPKIDIDDVPPVDRLNLVFLILVLHGIGILMPWNMFITAESYFVNYKLNTTLNSTEDYGRHFLSYIGVAAQIPNVLFNALNVFFQFGGGNVTVRIIGSILIEIVIFIITIILAMLDSTAWCREFFYITMVSVVLINMVNGVYQNNIYGLAAKLPMKYSMAIILGSNTSGTFASLMSIISIAASPNEKTAAIYYFISALFVLLACIDTYFALPLIRFYRYYDRLVQRAIIDAKEKSKRLPYLKIFKQVIPQCFNVWFVFFVTLTIFPAILANIKPVDPNFIIPQKYFTPVTCFLNFNFFAMLGSLLPNWIKWPGPKFLWIPVSLRGLMIPYFMICNYIPDKRSIPVFISNDWAYTGMGFVLGLTNGYCSSLAMMYAPKCVDTEHAPIAGMISAFFLVLGIVCGVNFTFFISWIVETKIF